MEKIVRINSVDRVSNEKILIRLEGKQNTFEYIPQRKENLIGYFVKEKVMYLRGYWRGSKKRDWNVVHINQQDSK